MPPTPAPKGFRSFISKNNRLLPFIGALLVFATFIVKDAWREQLKDLVTSIDSAESTFIIRSEAAEANEQLRTLAQRADGVQAQSASKPPATAESEDQTLELILGMEGANTKALDASLDNVSRLLQKLPYSAEGLHDLRKQNTELERLRKLQQTISQLGNDRRLYRAGIHAPWEKPSDVPSVDDLSRQLDKAIPELLYGIAGLQQDTDLLAVQSLRRAHDVRESRERSYKVSTWASYGLYVLGWGLGFLGRVFSVDGLEAEA